MRKAKIICTIGPASSSKSIIDKMVKAGMNVARLNFSHGTHEEHKRAIKHLRHASRKYYLPVAILQDLKGLKIRIGAVKNGVAVLKRNSTLSLTTEKIAGDNEKISVSYPNLVNDVKTGDKILIDDGLIKLRVTGKTKKGLTARVIEGGVLRENKGLNLPGTRISGGIFTSKDKADLKFGIQIGVDYVAMSFVRSGKDVVRVKNWLKKHDKEIPVIAKIENGQALENIDEIIDVSDGIMVARGDLGVEVPLENVPLIQKALIEKCNAAMKPVITATQMLESMKEHTSPTRAETADVANAVLDGTDALMLSAETSIGKYPFEAVKMMDKIINYTEMHKVEGYSSHIVSKSFAQAIAEAACISSMDVKAKAIVAFSRSGFTALLVSKFRPHVPIIGFTVSEDIQRRMNLYWGIIPHMMKFPDNTDEMIAESEKALLQKDIVKKGDAIVIIATSPFALGSKTNIMKLHKVGV